jgi:perosamine synthetase
MIKNLGRRQFMGTLSGVAAGAGLAAAARPGGPTVLAKTVDEKPALLGGKPVRSEPFPGWPVIEDNERRGLRNALDSAHWNRGTLVRRFEREWGRMLDARYTIATSSGTAALYTCLHALDVGPGDEVIVPPYTFVASINVVLLHHALPVFVDSDRRTFQIDARKVEAAVTENTRCVMPVHLGGNMADLDSIMEIASRRNLTVLEDACQSHLGEWRGRKAGTIGDLGCFSFQASKNLNSGEGGAINTQNTDLAALCASFHNAGRPYRAAEDDELVTGDAVGFSYARNGDNRRLTEFQGAVLLEQLTRLEEQTRVREENAKYLTSQLKEIPGIAPAEEYEGCTRNAYHLYMFRYDPEGFSDLPRSRFLEALEAEGVPCGGGYDPLNREPFLKHTLESRGFQKIYGERRIREWVERNQCPENDRLCREAVWLYQTQLLAGRGDMDDVAAAVRKIRKHASELA